MSLSIIQASKDNRASLAVLILALLVALASLFYYLNPANVPIGNLAWNYALIDLVLILACLPLAVFTFMSFERKDQPRLAYSYGSLLQLGIGLGAAWLLFGLIWGMPFLFAGINNFMFPQSVGTLGISGDFQAYVFVADVQPGVEELIRLVLTASTAVFLFFSLSQRGGKAGLIVCAIVSVLFWAGAFALYHAGSVYSNQAIPAQDKLPTLGKIFLYGVYFSSVNLVLGTGAFSIMYHKLHNTASYISERGLPNVPLWFAGIEVLFFLISLLIPLITLYVLITNKKARDSLIPKFN